MLNKSEIEDLLIVGKKGINMSANLMKASIVKALGGKPKINVSEGPLDYSADFIHWSAWVMAMERVLQIREDNGRVQKGA